MTREEQIRKALAEYPANQGGWVDDLRYLLDKVAQLTLSITTSRRVTTDQARRLTLLSAQRSTLVEEVCHLQPEPPIIAHMVSGQMIASAGPLVVHRYGHDGRPPAPKCWGSE